MTNETVKAQHEETGRMWEGPRDQIPAGYAELPTSKDQLAHALERVAVYRKDETTLLPYARSMIALADEIGRLQRELGDKKARIDALMLEYCPDEVTGEQAEEWGKHQRLSSTPSCLACEDRPGPANDPCLVCGRAAHEPGEVPDAWLVIEPDGWRYLSGGEGDAKAHIEERGNGGKVYPLYRAAQLPDYRRAMKQAEGDDGIDSLTLVRVLQKKVADQQRELARLNARAAQPPKSEALRAYIFEQLGFLCDDDNRPAEALIRIAVQRLTQPPRAIYPDSRIRGLIKSLNPSSGTFVGGTIDDLVAHVRMWLEVTPRAAQPPGESEAIRVLRMWWEYEHDASDPPVKPYPYEETERVLGLTPTKEGEQK
jgi:hypothetical protein